MFITNLTKLVTEWIMASIEVLICLDANEEMDQLNPEEGLGCLISSTGLINLH